MTKEEKTVLAEAYLNRLIEIYKSDNTENAIKRAINYVAFYKILIPKNK